MSHIIRQIEKFKRSSMKRSAGILLYRRTRREPEVLLVHPGGPFWAKKDTGAWSIPKGEYRPDEDALQFSFSSATPDAVVNAAVSTVHERFEKSGGKGRDSRGIRTACDPSRPRCVDYGPDQSPRQRLQIYAG